jgi:hypothetical protein
MVALIARINASAPRTDRAVKLFVTFYLKCSWRHTYKSMLVTCSRLISVQRVWLMAHCADSSLILVFTHSVDMNKLCDARAFDSY